jgi:hypothetical protein
MLGVNKIATTIAAKGVKRKAKKTARRIGIP